MLIYYPVFTRIYNLLYCDKDGINVAVALIIISNAVNESQAGIVYKPFHAGSVAPDMVIEFPLFKLVFVTIVTLPTTPTVVMLTVSPLPTPDIIVVAFWTCCIIQSC
jgi:hypothetical protein